MNDPAVITLPFPDAQARARIGDDLDTNLLVEAGAGSGKITELVTRMVALVASGVATVDEIAAVTFTRKAAAALRERFQMHLEQRVAEPREADGDHSVRARLSTALDDIDRIFVGTIHAFCSRLLRERPLEIGLDPAFEELAVEERLRLHRQFGSRTSSDSHAMRTLFWKSFRMQDCALRGCADCSVIWSKIQTCTFRQTRPNLLQRRSSARSAWPWTSSLIALGSSCRTMNRSAAGTHFRRN